METNAKRGGGFTLASLVTCLGKLLGLIALAIIIFITVRLTLQIMGVNGDSMEPSLHDGQYLLISKVAYRFHPPQRGDIVTLRSPWDSRRTLVKRVIALPGERVLIKAGHVFIDGHRLEEPYLLEQGDYSYGPLTIEEGEYFVLGDNRLVSTDSQVWGPLSKERIIGKAWFCLWPPRYGGQLPSVSYGATD